MNTKIVIDTKSTADISKELQLDVANLLVQSPQVIASEVLFSGARELIIAHAGEAYRLRLTNQGKLILTK